ncbi:MAG: serpin family protein, partial [Nitrosotalea sp.]
ITQKDTGNVFFSPYSITNAFSMIYEGAQGATSDEMESVFHFIKDNSARKNYILQTNSELASPDQQYKLGIANAVWIQDDYPILQNYTNTLEKYYAANATSLDLKNDSENSRNTINNWVADKTNQKILNLLPEGTIDQNTRLVLTNAIYFKGNWTNQFDPLGTSNQNFTTLSQGVVKVSMMSSTKSFGYFADNDTQVLKMPYLGGRLSMIVLLPKDGNISSLVNSLSVEKLQQWNSNMVQEPVTIYIPKFTLDTKYTLNDYLSSMGMPSVFLPNVADLSGITGNDNLFIGTAIHQAFVTVDEKGTEAAAATGGTVEALSMLQSNNTFRADHPFVFMIYDDQTGLVLFIGQVVNPSS